MSESEVDRLAREQGGIALVTTAAIEMLPGVSKLGVLGRITTETAKEVGEEYLIARLTGEDHASAVGKGVIGGLISKTATTGMEASNPALQQLQQAAGMTSNAYPGGTTVIPGGTVVISGDSSTMADQGAKVSVGQDLTGGTVQDVSQTPETVEVKGTGSSGLVQQQPSDLDLLLVLS